MAQTRVLIFRACRTPRPSSTQPAGQTSDCGPKHLIGLFYSSGSPMPKCPHEAGISVSRLRLCWSKGGPSDHDQGYSGGESLAAVLQDQDPALSCHPGDALFPSSTEQITENDLNNRNLHRDTVYAKPIWNVDLGIEQSCPHRVSTCRFLPYGAAVPPDAPSWTAGLQLSSSPTLGRPSTQVSRYLGIQVPKYPGTQTPALP